LEWRQAAFGVQDKSTVETVHFTLASAVRLEELLWRARQAEHSEDCVSLEELSSRRAPLENGAL